MGSKLARNLWAATPTIKSEVVKVNDYSGITVESEEIVHERLRELRESNERYYARKMPAIKKKENTWSLRQIKCDWQTFSTFLDHQRYECACCGANIYEHSAYVDYSAVTGMVRGLLCNNCDLMIIGACDSVEKLISGIVYMRSFFNAVTEPKMPIVGRETTNEWM